MKYLSVAVLLATMIGSGSELIAASVTKLDKKKRVVKIDEGSKSGIKKKQKICFRTAEDKAIGCGRVIKVKKTYSYVKVKSSKKFKKIKTDSIVDLLKSSDSSQSGSSKSASKSKRSSGKFMGVRLLYVPSLLSQTGFKDIAYKAPSSTETDSTLWKEAAASSMALLSFGIEFEIFDWKLVNGYRFRMYQKRSYDSNYSATDTAEYATTDTASSAIGAYLDYYFLSPGSGSGIKVGAGLDLDISTLGLISDHKSDNDATLAEPLYTYDSSLLAISLRIPLAYQLAFSGDTLGITAGLNLAVPIFATDPTVSADIQDPNFTEYEKADNTANSEAAREDIQNSIAHDKQSFAVEFTLGMHFAF